ncbi:unnamed protein product [Lactuca virosa]|uniref:Uncharacterized protein n=1 Tax=Lactuca virosa TaxID=75947 RepID=A0AAU9N971_9ASTR|nr:unnamed protein product [Lactuca virosa]
MGINPTPLPQLGWASLVTDLPSRSPSLDVISFSPYPSRNFFHNSYHHRHLCWFLSPPTNALVVSPKLRSPSSSSDGERESSKRQTVSSYFPRLKITWSSARSFIIFS